MNQRRSPLTVGRLLTLSLFSLLFAAPAQAGDGDKYIALLDKAQTRAKDQHFLYDVITQEPGKERRVIKMDVRIKGAHWRRTDFTAPGDVKGMKALVLGKKKTYIYLPAYRKVRRMASHVDNQDFMGTMFALAELAMTSYGDTYSCKLLKETKTHWQVAATARDPKAAPYPRLELDIRKDIHHPTEIRYINKQGKKVKTEVRSGFTCTNTPGGEVCNAVEMKMTSHVRNGAWTNFVRTKWEVNTGVKDRFFTVRAIQRGR